MLRLALMNLMRNGAEAISEEQTERSVFVRTAGEDGFAVIEVTLARCSECPHLKIISSLKCNTLSANHPSNPLAVLK
jgi:hypothetical protein